MTDEIAKKALITYIASRVKINDEDSRLINERFHLKQIKKKNFFLQEGATSFHQGFIVSGTFRVYYTDPKASEHVLYFGFKDWWVGDIASFHTNEPSKVSVQAMEDSWILEFSNEDIEYLFAKVSSLERLFRIMAQRTLAVLQKRFLMTISASAEERYLELIERHQGIEQLVPQHQIASYLGILPESLSRMKKQLVEKAIKKE